MTFNTHDTWTSPDPAHPQRSGWTFLGLECDEVITSEAGHKDKTDPEVWLCKSTALPNSQLTRLFKSGHAQAVRSKPRRCAQVRWGIYSALSKFLMLGELESS